MAILSSPVFPWDFDIISKDTKVKFSINAGQAQMEVWIPEVAHTDLFSTPRSPPSVILTFMETWIPEVTHTVYPVCHIVHSPIAITFMQLLGL